LGRHRAGGSRQEAAAYHGAGKRRRAPEPSARPATGRHKQAGRRIAAAGSVPAARVVGAAAIAGAVGLLGSASSLESETPLRETAVAAGARPIPSAPQREPSVSRSGQRGDVSSAAGPAQRQAIRRERALAVLSRQANNYARELVSDRWVLPMTSYRLTGRFGETSYLWSTVHTGLDFAAPDGTDIHAVAAGEVTEAGWAGSYGYRTIVELEDGTEIWYCHQSSIAVEVGDQVARGQVIGDVGSTGNVTGPHLHLEVRRGGGDPVDPALALAEHDATP